MKQVLLFSIFALVGCQTVRNFESKSDAMIGKGEQVLFAERGAPTNVVAVNDKKVWVYESKDVRFGFIMGNLVRRDRHCQASYFFGENQTIENVRFIGNNCR